MSKVSSKLDQVFNWVNEARSSKTAVSIAYHGNIVDLLEYADQNNIKCELISDQTSCHAVYEGGYTPVGYSFEAGRELLEKESCGIQESCRSIPFSPFPCDQKPLRQGFTVLGLWQ